MINPVLSIIIVNFNTAGITTNCLKSVFADKGLEFDLSKVNSTLKTPTEIILIDNHSTDHSLIEFKKLKHPFHLVSNQENVGFGRAVNQGIKISHGNFVLLLNSDTLILHSAISQSLDWLSSHPESYGCTAQLLNADRTIQPSGGYFPNFWNIAALLLHLDDLPFINSFIPPYHPHSPNFYTHDNFFTKDHSQNWVTGAFMLIRKNVLDRVGGFDPNFFMYGEEMELCYRIHQQFSESQLWYLVGPQIIHLGGASTTDKQKIFDREYRGISYFFWLHRPHYQQKIIGFLININRYINVNLFKHLSYV